MLQVMMFDPGTLAVFITATLALNLTPGPDVLYVLANSAQHGRIGGVLASLGVSCGIVLHTCLAAFGVTALLLAHAWAFDALRIAGALYLILLGILALRASPLRSIDAVAVEGHGAIALRGFLTNAFNPKVALFFLAFLPQFVDASRGSAAVQILVLGAIFVTSGTLVNVAYAWAGGWLADVLRREPLWRRRLDRFSGGVLIVLGLRLLFVQQSPAK
jgi:threonine/homoserine/homoserine lactone efflux protein